MSEPVKVILGKPGDPCAEGDGRPSIEGFWCGACHMAAAKEMDAYQADRIEAGFPECDWFERQALEHAVVEAAVQARRNGLAKIDPDEDLEQLRRLWRAADTLIAHRGAR